MNRLALVLFGLAIGVGCASEDNPAEDVGSDPPKEDRDFDGGVPGSQFTLDGFSTPESALYDSTANVILVSNINGTPGNMDDNGFISRVSVAGKIMDLKWIDGADEAVTLHAPKGMGIIGERLFATDITVVRVFDRKTGAPAADIPIDDASFLNDIAVDEKNVFVSDSSDGVIYKIDTDFSVTIFADESPDFKPNGLAVWSGMLHVATGGGMIVPLALDAETLLIEADTGVSGLDGLVILESGTMLVSSWDAQAVLRSTAGGSFEPIIEALSSPADIGYFPDGELVLVPLFNENRLVAFPLPD